MRYLICVFEAFQQAPLLLSAVAGRACALDVKPAFFLPNVFLER